MNFEEFRYELYDWVDEGLRAELDRKMLMVGLRKLVYSYCDSIESHSHEFNISEEVNIPNIGWQMEEEHLAGTYLIMNCMNEGKEGEPDSYLNHFYHLVRKSDRRPIWVRQDVLNDLVNNYNGRFIYVGTQGGSGNTILTH